MNEITNDNEKENKNESTTFIHLNTAAPEIQTYVKNYNKVIPLFFRNGDPLIVIGPQWPLFICVLSIIVTITVMILLYLYTRIHFIFLYLGILISLVQLSSYLYTALINPGLPKTEYENIIHVEEGKNYRQCKDCKFWINTDEVTFHCNDCDICIEGYDHHCIWMSKCVGKNNTKSFYIFIIFTFILFVYFILAISLSEDA